MKRLFALLLCFVMVLSLAACGSSAPANNTSSTTEGSTESVEPAEPEITYTEGFFNMELPFEPDQTFDGIESDWHNADNDDQRVSIDVSAYEKTAQEAVDSYNGEYEVGEAFEAGDFTWIYVNAYNNRYEYYADLSDGHNVCVTVFGYEAKDPDIVTMLESLKVSDNPFEDNQEYLAAKWEAQKAAEAEESESE